MALTAQTIVQPDQISLAELTLVHDGLRLT
jgi:hypothetical protein